MQLQYNSGNLGTELILKIMTTTATELDSELKKMKMEHPNVKILSCHQHENSQHIIFGVIIKTL